MMTFRKFQKFLSFDRLKSALTLFSSGEGGGVIMDSVKGFSYAASKPFPAREMKFSDFKYLLMGIKKQFLFIWNSTRCQGNPTVKRC